MCYRACASLLKRCIQQAKGLVQSHAQWNACRPLHGSRGGSAPSFVQSHVLRAAAAYGCAAFPTGHGYRSGLRRYAARPGKAVVRKQCS